MKPSSSKAKGYRFEKLVTDYLRERLEDDRIERRRLGGANDRGDIAGVRFHLQRVVIECKNVKPRGKAGNYTDSQILGWLDEAERERGNDDAYIGVVIAKHPLAGDRNKSLAGMHLVFAVESASKALGWDFQGKYCQRCLDDFITALGG